MLRRLSIVPLKICKRGNLAVNARPYTIDAFATPTVVPFPVIVRNQLDAIKPLLESVLEGFSNGILFIKRTFQPSLLRRKRKHGYLARVADKDGRKVLARRKAKGRKNLCA